MSIAAISVGISTYTPASTRQRDTQSIQDYIDYVQNLPLSEQNSQKFAGTLQSARVLLETIGTQDSTKSKPTDGYNPTVSRFNTTDIVDLSPTAQAYLSQAAKKAA